VVEGVVGFAVIFNQRFNAYVPTIQTTAVLFERLSADAARVANGPLNLLESTSLNVYYRKIITRTMMHFLYFFIYFSHQYRSAFSWGVLIFENIYSLNMVTGGSLSYTLSKRSWRLILALMIRESIVVGLLSF